MTDDTPSIYDLLVEMRAEMRARFTSIEHILSGDGSPGLCEVVRGHTADFMMLKTMMAALTGNIDDLRKTQALHQEWHALPENYTLQEFMRHRGVLFFVGLVIMMLALIGAAVGIKDAVAFLKGLPL